MMYYIVYIFEMAGLTGNQNLLAASIQYIIVSVHHSEQFSLFTHNP